MPCFTLPIHVSVLPKIHRLLFLPSSFLLHSSRRLLLLFFTSLWCHNWT
ncbi:hypothetical protein Gogos_000710 [Gossypium gossypioides]|uniref:Uncharacterized protein n=1 Tax=Gossypium gossypioides TaxID=34282 RepID=A0A7J9CTI1_GOSGO|nr:hypothetical protein [Gossypium gossypioides]